MSDTETSEVVIDCELDAPAEKVWKALTEHDLLSEWLDAAPMDTPLSDRAGYEIIHTDPCREITYGWRHPGTPPSDRKTQVIVHLTELDNGKTRFRLVHELSAASRTLANDNIPPTACAA